MSNVLLLAVLLVDKVGIVLHRGEHGQSNLLSALLVASYFQQSKKTCVNKHMLTVAQTWKCRHQKLKPERAQKIWVQPHHHHTSRSYTQIHRYRYTDSHQETLTLFFLIRFLGCCLLVTGNHIVLLVHKHIGLLVIAVIVLPVRLILAE